MLGGVPVLLVAERSELKRRLAQLSAHPRPLPGQEYRFLVGRFIDSATLERATALAGRWGVHPHEVLIANGWLDAEDYYRALAAACGIPFKSKLTPADVTPAAGAGPRRSLASGLLKERARARRFVLAPDRLRPTALRDMLARLRPHAFSLASPQSVRGAICHQFAETFAHGAVEGLASRYPDRSARERPAIWQRLALVLGLLAFFSGLAIAPASTIWLLTLFLAVLFVPVVGLRLVATYRLLHGGSDTNESVPPRVPDVELPVYTLLVPLFREAHMLPRLLHGLTHLDWPAAKLDIKLILEAIDLDTVAAARALNLPGNVEIVVVPELHPRTKPKALNYALPLARGEYLVIFDAEDRPDRDQLRRAFALFRRGPPNLACVQAALNIYNASDTWLTRQFTLEYCALFDALLPALATLRLPIPLGGTSNHFRVSALKWLMAWDPFNVTEDADLGIRLARSGYRCAVLPSTTYEEAPRSLMSWLRQRTRWLKGYIQTWLVHMRFPGKLWRELGPLGFIGFQTIVGGTILSALVHPWFYVLAAIDLARGGLLVRPESLLGWPFWAIAWFDLATGYLVSMTLGVLSAQRRGYRRLLKDVALMPLYWLLISAAAYRAICQFMTARFEWEKTEHGLSSKERSQVLDAPESSA
jgi:cellulose synthase/poly-beta-1,6-N-acetylglucosamine synthase-like glycosyltransferase